MSVNVRQKLDFVNSLNKLRQDGIGCDVIIQVGDRSFLAHRVVLIARLEYFRKRLTIDMLEQKQLVVQLDPEIIRPEIFSDLLDYIYQFKLNITLENFEPICKAANYFCITELLNKAKHLMRESLKERDIGLMMNLATGNSSKELEKECEKLLISNPESEIARKLLIPTLSMEYLKILINKLRALSKQEDAFNYCIEWILHDEENRKDRMTELLETISLDSLSCLFLRRVVLKNELVMNNHESLQLLAFALANNDYSPSGLYVIGGKDADGMGLSLVSKYNLKTKEWKLMAPMKARIAHFGVALKEQMIYICGGFYSWGTILNSFQVFDTQTNEWKSLSSMSIARTSVAAAELYNHIYIAGGRNGNSHLASVQRYSIATGKWQELAPMICGRSGLELVEIRGYLYAIGGWNGKERLNTVERYDPEKNEWKNVASMNNKLAWFGSTVLDGKIYVAGAKAFEVYDPTADVWKVLPPPTECGSGRQLATINGRIYSIGGCVSLEKDNKGIRSVEYFDVCKQKWIQIEDMDIARCYHRVVVVKCD